MAPGDDPQSQAVGALAQHEADGYAGREGSENYVGIGHRREPPTGSKNRPGDGTVVGSLKRNASQSAAANRGGVRP
jgi:hypothetical protein